MNDSSVDVALVAVLARKPRYIGLGVGGREAAMRAHDLGQRAVDVARHAFGVAADIDMRAGLEPRPQLPPVLAHPVLDVDLVLLVAREGGVEPREQAVA